MSAELISKSKNNFEIVTGWSVGPKLAGRNDISTIRLKYYDKTKNQRAEITIRVVSIGAFSILSRILYSGNYS